MAKTGPNKFKSKTLAKGKAGNSKPIKKSKSKKTGDIMDFDIEKLRSMIRSDNPNDSTTIEMTRQFYRASIEAVEIAIAAYRDKPHAHNSYAMKGLMDQSRELAADLRQLEDIETQRSDEIMEIIHVVMKRFGFQIAQQLNLIKAEADRLTGEDRSVIIKKCDQAGQTLAQYTAQMSESLIDELVKGK